MDACKYTAYQNIAQKEGIQVLDDQQYDSDDIEEI